MVLYLIYIYMRRPRPLSRPRPPPLLRYSMELDPRLIDELDHEEIVHVSAGHSHAAAVTKEGESVG